ncbi:hypothetical protein O159_26290 [Leifsonia xyli subsp. cynodontis DSM 46306]|uniref:HTH cro/C1-type domain-containing protein n=1 Tax=Leifsonia xyli subsp. cynodontis DSM 46306 TaxID=1389489 RepID=U3PAI2_LEIXC|nr:hypothetical protein O159_26290 [Leifsonia xyli subsp. cynodontis DSM 46306]
MSRATAYRRLNGSDALDADEIEKIATALGMKEADLLESADFGRRIAERATGEHARTERAA